MPLQGTTSAERRLYLIPSGVIVMIVLSTVSNRQSATAVPRPKNKKPNHPQAKEYPSARRSGNQ